MHCALWCISVYCVTCGEHLCALLCARCCNSVHCVTCGEHSPPLGGHTTIHCSPTLVLKLNSLTESLCHSIFTPRITLSLILPLKSIHTQLTPRITLTLNSHSLTNSPFKLNFNFVLCSPAPPCITDLL